MSFHVSEVTKKWGAPTTFVPVPPEDFERYAERVPGFLLRLWQELGYSGFQQGLLWLCDPDAWQPAVDAWTADIDLPLDEDHWTAVTRSAFGRMQLWGRRTGMSLTITPLSGWLLPTDNSDEMSTEFDRDVQVLAAFLSTSRSTLDPTGDDDKPLFNRLLKKLGPVGPDTVYGFTPASGRQLFPEHAEILDATTHMRLLSRVTRRTVLVNDPYR